jgi:SAM-dependent methyltransferase
VSFDASSYRTESRRSWGSVAEEWGRQADKQMRAAMPVTLRMLDAARLQPGMAVLELAAGPGDVGFLALEMIQPGGTLITSDFAPEMLDQAQRRAHALGLDGIRFKQIDAESIDLHAASLDVVLCRWGFMLMADPNAALRECRRVLRPGGRLVLAAWTAAADNRWSSVVSEVLVERGHAQPGPADAPGQFAWADRALIEEHLAGAGFVDDIEVEAVDFPFGDETFEQWYERTLAMSRSGKVIAGLPVDEQQEVREALRRRLSEYARPDGLLEIPARSWVASASA